MLGCALLLVAGGTSGLHAQEPPRGQELQQVLRQTIKFPGFDDPKMTLSEGLECLAKRYNLSFDINEEAFKQAEIHNVAAFEIIKSGSIPEMHRRLGTVLQKILGRVSLSAMYIIRDDLIEITTQDAVRKEFCPDHPTGPLPPLVSASFDKVPLKSAFKEMSHVGNIVIDGRMAKDAETPVTADLANVPLDTAVRMLADMAGLKVVALDNVLYVTDKENVRVLLEEQEKLRLQRQPEKKKEDKPAEDKDKAGPSDKSRGHADPASNGKTGASR
jgi:hypothetical protein